MTMKPKAAHAATRNMANFKIRGTQNILTTSLLTRIQIVMRGPQSLAQELHRRMFSGK
jgi:hypothetical protein